MRRCPFRIGTTSYILPDDLLPNARYLAGIVQDMELVLFDLDDGQSNLPGPDLANELKVLSDVSGLSYTVHLPLDLRLGVDGNEQHCSLEKARRVIDVTREMMPWAYVLHLDGRDVRHGASREQLLAWQDQAVRVLEIVSNWVEDPKSLAVENLEGYPIDFIEPVLERSPVSRCVDIGHLWVDGHDPAPFLERAFLRTRVIHVHGIHERDHQSLAYIPDEQIDCITKYLLDRNFAGVVTLEVFGEQDFHSSFQALLKSLSRHESVT